MEPFVLYLVGFLVVYLLTEKFISRLRNLPPSPLISLPLIGHLYLYKEPLHRALAGVAASHGPVVLLRFGSRHVLLVSSASAAEDCLKKNDICFANRPHGILSGEHLGYNYSTILWAPYGRHWRKLRRIASAELLSPHSLHESSEIRADEVSSLIRRLRSSGHQDQAVNVKAAFFELTLNIMMRLIAGKRYYGEKVGDSEEARRFQGIVAESFRLGGVSNVSDFIPFIRRFGFRGTERKMVDLFNRRDEFMQDLIDEHRHTSPAAKKTMIRVLLSLQDKEPEKYDDRFIKSLTTTLLLAATDTSSATMEWALSSLLNNPPILKKAQAEIDEAVGRGRLVEESDLEKLPYLHAIVVETLRLYPPGPLLVPHESSAECGVGGYRVPPTTMLLINLWAIQRSPELWSHPGAFMPERFAGLEGNRVEYKLMPFGAGGRSCPGEGLATRVVELALGALIQCFEWRRVSEEMVDMTEGSGLTMPKLRPLMAKCRPRVFMPTVTSRP